MRLSKWIKSLFRKPSRQDNIENFLATKNPKSAAEAEYWVRYYYINKTKGWVL